MFGALGLCRASQKFAGLAKMLRNPMRFYEAAFWDLKTEKAKHHSYIPVKDPLWFCLRKPGKKILSPKKSPPQPFKKYKLRTHSGMIARVKIVGPVWKREFLMKQAGVKRNNRKKRRQTLKNKKKYVLVSPADKPKVKKLIPYYRSQLFKYTH